MSQIRFQVPQAFRDLGISFFLHLTPEADAELKRHHVRETRRLHPDLMPIEASDEEREASEGQLATLNSAFLHLRDTHSRLDLVIHQILEDNPSLKHSAKPEMPASLAMEYFELQEALEEKPGDPATLSALKEFTAQVSAEASRLSTEIETLLSKLNSHLERTGTTISIDSDAVNKLLAARNRERYLIRLKDDLLGTRRM